MRISGFAMSVLLSLALLPATGLAQTPDARLRADVEQLLEITGATKVGAQMAAVASGQVLDAMKASSPEVPERAVMLVREVLNTEFVRAFDPSSPLRRTLIDIYAKHYTHDEIIALLTFYSSDVGRKTALLTPTLAREGAVAGQQWAADNMPRIAATLQSRLRAEGLLK